MTRRLNQSILQHVTSTVHQCKLAIHEHNNNNINIGVGHILFEDNAIDDISVCSFVDAHDVPGSDLNEFSTVGIYGVVVVLSWNDWWQMESLYWYV
jgi:hypothetical protein